MNRFSPSDAALEGFRLTRERPGTVLGWAVIYALGLLAIGWIMLASLDPQLVATATKRDLTPDDLEAISGMLEHSLPAFILVLLLVVTLTSVITGGIFRVILRPEERGFLFLRLGRDEFRLTIVNLLLFAIGMICLVTGILAISIGQQTGSIAGLATTVLVGVLSAWLGVRLCLVTPMTFAHRRIAIGPAWELSRGRFWALLGMIVLAVIFYIMVLVLMSIIVAAVVGLAGGQEALSDASQLTPVAWVALLVSLAFQFVLQVLQIVMIYGPFAIAYQQISGDRARADG